jgi:hypothetical protein
MDPDKIMNGITKEIFIALKEMENSKSAKEKLMYSKIVKNLCDSLGIFLNLISEMGLYVEEEEDEGIPF